VRDSPGAGARGIMRAMNLAALALALPVALQADTPAPVAVLRAEAERVLALVECKGTKAFLAATSALPEIGERVVAYDPKAREARTAEELAALPAEERARFQPASFDGGFYYTTRSGSPLAYARMLRRRRAPERRARERRAHPASACSTSATAASATCACSPASAATWWAWTSTRCCTPYYRAEDQGPIARAKPGGAAGKLALVHGRFPAEAAVKQAIGQGYDLRALEEHAQEGLRAPGAEGRSAHARRPRRAARAVPARGRARA
jgi:hypothetical protein